MLVPLSLPLSLKMQIGLQHSIVAPLLMSHASSLLLNEVQVFENMNNMVGDSLRYFVFIAFLIVPVIVLNKIIAPKLNMINPDDKKEFF